MSNSLSINDLIFSKVLSEDKKRLRSLISIVVKRKNDARLAEMRLQKMKEELKKAQEQCASHRVFISRINKEVHAFLRPKNVVSRDGSIVTFQSFRDRDREFILNY